MWSFLIEIIGSSITSNDWLLDTAVLTHLGPVPAASLNWTAIAWLTALALIAALTGYAAFRQRDLAAAYPAPAQAAHPCLEHTPAELA